MKKTNYFSNFFIAVGAIAIACCMYLASLINKDSLSSSDRSAVFGLLCFCYFLVQFAFNKAVYVLRWWPNIITACFVFLFYFFHSNSFNTFGLYGLGLGMICGYVLRKIFLKRILDEGWLPEP